MNSTITSTNVCLEAVLKKLVFAESSQGYFALAYALLHHSLFFNDRYLRILSPWIAESSRFPLLKSA